MVYVGQMECYTQGVELLEKLADVDVCEAQLYRVTNTYGALLEPEIMQDETVPELGVVDEVEVVYAEMDGGMILTDDEKAYEWFKLARFNGRNQVPHITDTIKLIGWNFYMTNIDAARGMWLLDDFDLKDDINDITPDYPDLSIYDFNESCSGEVLKLK